MDLKKIIEDQKKLAPKISSRDAFSKYNIIAGIDHHTINKKMTIAIALFDIKGKKVVETTYLTVDEPFKYIPFTLSHRVGPSIVAAYQQLKNEPDILIVNGTGVSHPRKFGLACQVGLSLNKPSIGITKSIPFGEIRNERIYIKDEAVGAEITTKQGAKPVYVSPGHNISLRSCIEITKSLIVPPHKLPEPLHLAHKLLSKLKPQLKEESKEEGKDKAQES